MNINVGGGKFLHRGWLNLDGRAGFQFTPTCTFPLDSAEIVYSSHCLEHLDDATVDRVLEEARRVGKTLVLKLPDFEEVLKRWRAGDHGYFQAWGMNGVVRTWKRRCIEDTIDARAAMIFCGWWNDEYGDEWGQRHPEREGAYHGPAVPLNLVEATTPHAIAAEARQYVPEGAHFNHQNAWSLAEMVELLTDHGFDVESVDKQEICQMPIPTIREMYDISMYLKAR